MPSRQLGPAAQLLRDWPRISEVAHQHALVQYVGAEVTKLWSSPAVRNRRDAQLVKAASKADEAATALREMVTLWSKHVDAPGQAALATWADTVTATLAQQREAIEQYRTRAEAWPKASVTRGQPTQPSTYLFETVLSYFRAHDWPCSLKRHSNPDGDVFVRVACVALRQSEVNPALRQTLAASRLKWAELEAAAPHLSEADRALHLIEANRQVPPRGRRPVH